MSERVKDSWQIDVMVFFSERLPERFQPVEIACHGIEIQEVK